MLYKVNTSTAPMRAESSDSSEMINELLYGEHIVQLEHRDNWIKVRSTHDDYEGWIALEYEPALVEEEENSIVALCEGQLDLGKRGLMKISPGSLLSSHEILLSSESTLATEDSHTLISAALMYLNTPYLWGGRSIWGIDCSGLIQVIYRICGHEIARDAYQQAELGAVVSIENARAGDLAFFKNQKGKITHVGLLTGSGEIIHASGRVRIDDMDSEGIIRRTDGKRSHSLSVIKRIDPDTLSRTR